MQVLNDVYATAVEYLGNSPEYFAELAKNSKNYVVNLNFNLPELSEKVRDFAVHFSDFSNFFWNTNAKYAITFTVITVTCINCIPKLSQGKKFQYGLIVVFFASSYLVKLTYECMMKELREISF